jgi:hypothetical protein
MTEPKANVADPVVTQISIDMTHDKVTKHKLRFQGEDETGMLTVGVYVAKTMPVHKMPEKILLVIDLAEIGTK